MVIDVILAELVLVYEDAVNAPSKHAREPRVTCTLGAFLMYDTHGFQRLDIHFLLPLDVTGLNLMFISATNL